MAANYYVQARIDISGYFAQCSYFYDKAGTKPVEGSLLTVAADANSCIIEQADGSELVLIAASYKTLGQAPSMTSKNFSPSDDEHAVSITMPTTQTVTKGVVLLFSSPDVVEALYASADPEITNGVGA